jgi:hypothetical protein
MKRVLRKKQRIFDQPDDAGGLERDMITIKLVRIKK